MRVGRKHEVCNIKVDDESLKQEKKMSHLGVVISSDSCVDREVDQRRGAAAKMFGARRSTVLGRKELMKCTKLRVVYINTMVIPILTHGCKALALQTKHILVKTIT